MLRQEQVGAGEDRVETVAVPHHHPGYQGAQVSLGLGLQSWSRKPVDVEESLEGGDTDTLGQTIVRHIGTAVLRQEVSQYWLDGFLL